MSCSDLHRAIASDEPSGPEVDAHLEACEPCSALVAHDGAGAKALHALEGDSSDALGDLWGSTLEAVENDGGLSSRLARTPSWMHAVALGGLVLALSLSQLAALRPDMEAYPSALMTLVLLAFAGPTVALILAATRPLYLSPLSATVKSALWLTALVIPLLVASLPATHIHPAMAITGGFAPVTLTCFAFGAAIALLVTGAHQLFQRRRHGDRDNTILAALVGALAAAIALQLHCPYSDNAHQILGHATQGILLVGGIFVWFSARRSH